MEWLWMLLLRVDWARIVPYVAAVVVTWAITAGGCRTMGAAACRWQVRRVERQLQQCLRDRLPEDRRRFRLAGQTLEPAPWYVRLMTDYDPESSR